MSRFLLFALVLAAVGCDGASTANGSGAGTPDMGAAKPDASVAKDKEAPKIPETKLPGTSTAPGGEAQKPSKAGNPNRIHQLADLKVVPIKAAGHTIQAWVMDDESKRTEGMMFLTSKDVRDDQGMIFVFGTVQPNDGKHGFWMANCPLGLDIIYISPQKTVLNVAHGKPFNETSLPPAGDYLFVLELKDGLAKRLGIGKGTKVDIPADLKSAD